MLQLEKPAFCYNPLETVTIACDARGEISVRDGWGREYFRAAAEKNIEFTAAGALGRHLVLLENQAGRVVDSLGFNVNCRTEIVDQDHFYSHLLYMLYRTMATFGESHSAHIGGKSYQFFVCWLRDHVHALKGMKYFYSEIKSAIDLFAEFQRDDGMIWDNIHRRGKAPNMWEQRFAYGDFIRKVENDTLEFKRIPVENDVEFLFLEGLYYTWKATGDDDWMAGHLDKALKALHYSTHDRYRWSEKYQLLKRGYTIDTWDFQNEEDAALSGGDPMRVEPGKTRFGVMFGDNTGMVAGCRYLAEMLDHAGREAAAAQVRETASALEERLNDMCWNGEFFKHHVPEDPDVQRDLGVDEDAQVSLSNAYSLNRGIAHDKAVEIIRTYQRIRQEMPATSPGEFYQIYPPFGKGYAHNGMWQYMNGGVTTIVAGELAHGAFEHGFEAYGVDILHRLKKLGAEHEGYFHWAYRGAMPWTPDRTFKEIDLRQVANTDIHGDGAEGVPGWTGEGDNDLRNMPFGHQVFHDIPFDVINPAKNGRRACLGLSRHEPYASCTSFDLQQNVLSVYLLHTMAGKHTAGTVTWVYEDGSRESEYMVKGQHVTGWWMPSEPNANINRDISMRVAWQGPNPRCLNVGVNVVGLNNPHPEKKVAQLVLDAAADGTKWLVLGLTLCDQPVFFMPSDLSFGIPENWGAAAVVYALIEGLAGIVDEGTTFDRVKLVPRWSAADVKQALACAKYEASGGYVRYKYAVAEDRLRMQLTGCAEAMTIELLVPEGHKAKALLVDGAETEFNGKIVESSAYVCFTLEGIGAHTIELEFA